MNNPGGESTLKKLTSRKIIKWLCLNYGIYILAFFTLGFMGNIKTILIINFALDVFICFVSFVLNIALFKRRYKTPLVGKVGLILITLFFIAFTYFAFLMPEAGMPPVLFA